ncbi:TorD/DmsD family molecular chaperone [Caenispirillum bisanense]|uniref:TorD/DmsD family molecular chaperone n=1 Tax=Caenispirillum bisanense TaxID=414052 RepID=UPI0031D7CA5F
MPESLPAADRAHLLSWLSSVFLREPDAAAVALMHGPQGDAVVAALAPVPPLAAEAAALIAALRRLRQQEDDDRSTALRLAGRFATLFLGASGPNGAHPYASVYEDGRTHGAATGRSAAFLAEHHLAVAEGVPEPADHIGIQLAALAALAEREAAAAAEDPAAADALRAAQAGFAAAEVRPWIDTFRARVEHDDPDGYYAAAARLTAAVLEAVAASPVAR